VDLRQGVFYQYDKAEMDEHIFLRYYNE